MLIPMIKKNFVCLQERRGSKVECLSPCGAYSHVWQVRATVLACLTRKHNQWSQYDGNTIRVNIKMENFKNDCLRTQDFASFDLTILIGPHVELVIGIILEMLNC